MDKSQILALMITATPIGLPLEWDVVLAEHAERLARVAPKLSEDELYGLIAIGATIYQRGCVQTEAEKETAQALLDIIERSKGQGGT